MAGSPVVGRLLKNPTKPATQLDVSDLIREARRDNRNTKSQYKKVRGGKPTPKTIEEKKSDLNMRRLERKTYG